MTPDHVTPALRWSPLTLGDDVPHVLNCGCEFCGHCMKFTVLLLFISLLLSLTDLLLMRHAVCLPRPVWKQLAGVLGVSVWTSLNSGVSEWHRGCKD